MRHKHHRYSGPEPRHPSLHAAAAFASAEAGLSDKEARSRLLKFGPNEAMTSPRLSAVAEFFLKFKNPLILVLLAAALLSFLLGERDSTIIIVVIVLFSVVLDFVNTVKSERAAEALKSRVAATVTVSRSGRPTEIAWREIVPGDLVLLEPGDMIPADGRVAIAKDFFINESAITGESFPVEKKVGDSLLMGSSITTGSGAMTVTATGPQTNFNKLAKSLVGEEELTDFDISMNQFSNLIMRVTFILITVTFLVNVFLQHGWLASFLFALALAVGLTPELLPMIIALNLTKGSLHLAKHGIIVRKLSALQSFGSMDTLCTDKTGTLTEDKITLVKYVDGEGHESDTVLQYAYLSSIFESGFRNPLDEAIKSFRHLAVEDWTKVDEIPFDFARKRSSVVAKNREEQVLITKGAPDELFEVCNLYGLQKQPFADKQKQKAVAEYTSLSQAGFRVLGVAIKKLHQAKEAYSRDDETSLCFLGFIAFLDPPKQTARPALDMLEKYGLTIKIITGDNELVTKRIATDLNLDASRIITGQQLSSLDDIDLKVMVEKVNIFARITPDQKERLIKVMRSNGHVVGYMGDGINDAPSIRAADVGISVSNAVDVAKESADLVMSEKSLDALVDGVVVGRKTFANTLKYLMMTLSSNFGNTFSVAIASFLLPWLPMLPAQILLNNLIYDTSQLSIPFDNVDEADISHPKKLGIRFIRSFMLVFGPVSSFFDILTFVVLYYVLKLNESAFQTGWFIESLITQTIVIYLIRTRRVPLLQSRPSLAVVLSTLGAIALALFLVLSPWRSLFGFSIPPLAGFVAIFLIVISYIVVVELVKKFFYRHAILKFANQFN